jgi:hypothetical protein
MSGVKSRALSFEEKREKGRTKFQIFQIAKLPNCQIAKLPN